jgi:uncharacterized protein
MDREQLIIFLKAPRVGTVKTRLDATLGAQAACLAYQILVDTLLGNLSALKNVELRHAPDEASREMEPWLRQGWTAQGQGEGDLGERLGAAFDAAWMSGCRRVVIIGSDCPEVTARDVRSAWRELRTHDLILGPANDGGYWLIGLSQPRPALFEGIAWSSDTVFRETLERARRWALKVHLLRTLTDVDTEADWNAFLRKRNATG